MAEGEWDQCKDWKWFQVESDAKAANNTMGLCIEEDLQRFRLKAGEVAHAEGRVAHRRWRRRPVRRPSCNA